MDNNFLLWCIPFFGISAFHLYACFIDSNKKANISKAILMPMLLFGVWGFTAITKGQSVLEQNTILLSLAIIFGGMGDVYLLNQTHVPSFIRGLVAFFLGHVFYLIVILSIGTFLPVPTIFIVIASIVYILLVIATWFMNKCQKGAMGVAMVLYALLLVGINAIALFLLVGYSIQHGFASIPHSLLYLFIGSLFFLISDAVLTHTIFIKTFPFHRFIVMLTYLAAQFFLVFGISLI